MSGWAMHPISSLNATPILTDPGSIPNALKVMLMQPYHPTLAREARRGRREGQKDG
jgi:hypothetical protein